MRPARINMPLTGEDLQTSTWRPLYRSAADESSPNAQDAQTPRRTPNRPNQFPTQLLRLANAEVLVFRKSRWYRFGFGPKARPAPAQGRSLGIGYTRNCGLKARTNGCRCGRKAWSGLFQPATACFPFAQGVWTLRACQRSRTPLARGRSQAHSGYCKWAGRLPENQAGLKPVQKGFGPVLVGASSWSESMHPVWPLTVS